MTALPEEGFEPSTFPARSRRRGHEPRPCCQPAKPLHRLRASREGDKERRQRCHAWGSGAMYQGVSRDGAAGITTSSSEECYQQSLDASTQRLDLRHRDSSAHSTEREGKKTSGSYFIYFNFLSESCSFERCFQKYGLYIIITGFYIFVFPSYKTLGCKSNVVN